MEYANRTVSKGALWTGWILSVVPALLLLLDGVMKFVKPPQVVEATTALGYTESAITPIGCALIVSTLLYLLPPTAGIGAILLTGYLGGAVASHVRHGDGPVTVSFAIIFAVILWTGLVLRDPRLRALLPWRR